MKFLGLKLNGISKANQLGSGADVSNVTAIETNVNGLVRQHSRLPRQTSANAVLKLANFNGRLSTQAALLAMQAQQQSQILSTAVQMHSTAVNFANTAMNAEKQLQSSKAKHAMNTLQHRMELGLLQNSHQGAMDGYGNAMNDAKAGFS